MRGVLGPFGDEGPVALTPTTRPSALRMRMALLTVAVARLYYSASLTMEGAAAPGCSLPDSIWAHIAQTSLVQARWADRILDEAVAAVQKSRSDIAPEKLDWV
jgi:hypothetical protein